MFNCSLAEKSLKMSLNVILNFQEQENFMPSHVINSQAMNVCYMFNKFPELLLAPKSILGTSEAECLKIA